MAKITHTSREVRGAACESVSVREEEQELSLNLKRRVAIIGLGPMGRRHLQALRLVENAKLVAASDTNPQVVGGVDLNGARIYGDAHAMLAAVRPDIVIVATNAPSHHQLVLAAVASGARGILCEKPIACSIAEAEEMITVAREHQCALAVNHSRRHVPAYAWLAQQIQFGEWGQLRSVQASWPGIGLGCLATHMVDLWRFLGGQELNSVFGWIDPVIGPNPRGSEYVDPGGMILAISASGVRYVHQQVEDGAGPGTVVIETTGAQIMIDEHSRSVALTLRDLSVKPGPGRPPKYDKVLPPPEVPFALDIVQLSACVLRELVQERALTCDAEHGLRALEIVVAAHLSHGRGHALVSLPIQDVEVKATWLPIT
jgi:predicted dehydrogenase